LVEIAQEEFEIIPSKNSFKHFKQDVRQMAADTDRIMARLAALNAKIAQATDKKPAL
jgi:ubiquinone biosynthesis protein UbiJ